MRALVTGATGFLGRHVVERLRREGFEPLPATRKDADLVDPDAVRRLFAEARPEVVFHLAAEVGGIGANRSQPGRYWFANLAMGLNVLEQSRSSGVEKLLLLGTVCAYPEETTIPFRETDIWDGFPERTNAPYGVAKRALLTGAQAYRDQYGLNSVYLLPANLYGPGDKFDLETSHVIPAVVRKMVEALDAGSAEVVLWGDGSPTREFLYVEDCAEALVLAAELYDGRDPVNLGTGEELSISSLARLIADVVGYRGEIVWDTSRPAGQRRRKLDVSRAEQAFGFRARTPLRQGLERTVAWYRERRSQPGAGSQSAAANP